LNIERGDRRQGLFFREKDAMSQTFKGLFVNIIEVVF
jgi:hypothetical protein